MTRHQFNKLTDLEQAVALFEGVLVAKRWYQGNRILLFQLYDFYIEICLDKERTEINWFISFSDLNLLDNYLPDIDISSLY